MLHGLYITMATLHHKINTSTSLASFTVLAELLLNCQYVIAIHMDVWHHEVLQQNMAGMEEHGEGGKRQEGAHINAQARAPRRALPRQQFSSQRLGKMPSYCNTPMLHLRIVK